MKHPLRIAIIGGGASGTNTTIHLLNKLKTSAEIYLIEKQKDAVYRGAAYSSGLEYEPLNVSAGKMSIFNNAPDDFLQWLKTKKQGQFESLITKDSFVSRRWFGEYLKDSLETAVKKTSNVKFNVVIGTVYDISNNPSEDGYEVFLQEAESIAADYLVFATGNESPAELFTEEEILLMGSNYIANPWKGNPFQNLKQTDDVLIVGTGLTMIDHVVSLHKRKHTGKIYALSRHGYLPLPHAGVSKYEFDLGAIRNSGLTNILREVKKNISKAKSAQISWQSVLDALREETPALWKSLDDASKKVFLKRLKPFWEIHRHRVPAESLEIIEGMRRNNSLQIIPGSIKGVKANEGKIVFNYTSKANKKESDIQINHIINCTGPDENRFTNNNPLFKNMHAKGWLRQDDLMAGIKTGANGEIIQQNMQPLKNAYAIGPLRKPAEWESTAVREIRTQAEKFASDLAQL